MATYAVGDVQGCDRTLGALLERVRFDSAADRLWLVGDLVNRGPRSLAVLRRLAALGDAVVAVLGNHDLHLLGRAHGSSRRKGRDTLDDVLAAPDRGALLDWLRSRPLVHREQGHVLVHAGLLPAWDGARAEALGREVEAVLARGELGFLDVRPARGFSDELTGERRLATIAAALTRLRVCTPEGRMELEFAGPPGQAPAGLLPWFDVPGRRSASETVVFGHWAALGLHVRPRLLGLDSGCVYGRALTALRLDDRALFVEPCRE